MMTAEIDINDRFFEGFEKMVRHGLEICTGTNSEESCRNCPYKSTSDFRESCIGYLMKDALIVIDRYEKKRVKVEEQK